MNVTDVKQKILNPYLKEPKIGVLHIAHWECNFELFSGKIAVCYGKSQSLRGKSNNQMVIFNSYVRAM